MKFGKVLVMDDTPIIRENLSKTLQYLGYDVIEAAEGSEAINKVRDVMAHSAVSLAILDVHVASGVDGVETAVRLREMDSSLKIIVSTGIMGSELEEKLADVRIDGVLQKPFTFEELKEMLESVEHRAAQTENSGVDERND